MDLDTFIIETITQVLEGGDSFGTGVVDRINKEDIKPTIEALQTTLLDKIGVDITSTRVLGSAGMKVSSGDLDVGIAGDLELEQIYAAVQKAGIQCKMNRGLSQVSIVFPQYTAQGPNGKNVQVDLVKGDLDYLAWSHSSSPENKGGVMIRAMVAGIIKVTTNQAVNNMRGVFSRGFPAKYKKTDADYSRDLNKLAQQISAKSKEPWTIADTTQPAGTIWEKVKRSFTPEQCSEIAAYFKEFMTTQKIPIPQWLGEGMAYDKGWQQNLSGQTAGGSANGLGGARNRGKVPKGMVPDTLRNKAAAPGNEDEGFKTQDPSDIYEAVDPKDMQKSIPHIDDLRPEQFIAFLKKYQDEPLRLEISEKVDGSARVSFGVGSGHIWTQGKHGSRKASSNQYPESQMFKALKMCHKALESKAQAIIAQWPEGVEFMVAEVLYTRIPNSIEYGPNVLMIHGVESAQGSLDDKAAKNAANAVIQAAGGTLTDGSEPWKFEYKREISPNDVAIDIRKEYDTLGQLYQDLVKKPRDRDATAQFKKIQKQVKEKLIKMLRSQKSVYGPEGGDVEGIVFRDLDSGTMVKLVDKDFFTSLNTFLWHYRQMLDKGVMAGGERKTGVMQGFHKVVADDVLGDPSAATNMLVKNLTTIGQSVKGKTPDQRADKTLAKYIKDKNLMSGDFARSFQRSLMGAFQDFGRLKQDWEEFKSKPQSIDIAGKKREFSKEIIQRTEEAFQGAEAALQGIKAGMQVAHGIKDPLTQKVALMKLFMGHKFQKLVDALGGQQEETVDEGIGSWARGIAAGAMLGAAGQSASDNTAPPPPDEISHHEETISGMIKNASMETGVPEELIAAIMSVESGGRPNAVSKKGARGLMQLMPKTAVSMGVTDIMDPQQNLLGGARYLKKLMKSFDGNLDWVIAAYNMGPTALHRAEGGKRPKETINYIRKVKALLGDKPIKLQTEAATNDMVLTGDEKAECRYAVEKFKPLLVKNGIKVGKYIGSGYYGSAYDIGGGKVLKVTDDPDEARASMHLMGKKLNYVVQFFKVFKFPQLSQKQLFGIVMEKVKTLKPGTGQEHQLSSAIREFVDVVGNDTMVDKSMSWDELVDYYESMIDYDPDPDMESIEVVQVLELFNIGKMRDELIANDIAFIDMHGGNIGYAKSGVWKAFDLGAESASPGSVETVPVLEGGPIDRMTGPTALDGKQLREPGLDDGEKANVMETMIFEQLRVLLESQQGTIGVTIGRFQPFHAGHAAIIRQLAHKYSSVVIFVAGQKTDAKNPFSHDLRLKMMEASLPDVWSKVKVFPATIQGKGTGYIPSLIANAAASGMSEIPMDGAVDVLVGQDRLKDQQTQAKHNEAHKGEPSYYPGTINVAALPDVKNDDDAGRISGTKIREALTNNDEQAVKKMLDPHLANGPEFANIYRELKDQMMGRGLAKEIVEAVINELGSGAQDGGGARQGGSSGWSRAILARDMTGEEIYQQMNRSPSTRMLAMANHGVPNDHLPGQDALDQTDEDEQDAHKPTDLGEMVLNSLSTMIEATRQEKEAEKKGLGVADDREIETSKTDKWNSWSIAMTDEIYNKKKVDVGGKILEVGPGEYALTIEPTSPAVGGQLQGGNIDYDIEKNGLRFEVKSITGAATMNLSKAGRKHNRNIKGMLWNLEKELELFMEKFKSMTDQEKKTISVLHHQGFNPNYIRWYLDKIDDENYDSDSITESRKMWLQKIIDDIHKYNDKLPQRMRINHEWVKSPAAFKNFIESMDLSITFKKTPGGLLLVDRHNGWFLIPAKDVGEWVVPTGSARGDLVLALKKRPSGGVKATKHERDDERNKATALKAAEDNALRQELTSFNAFKAANGRNKEQKTALSTLNALRQRKLNPSKDPMYLKFIEQFGTQEPLPTPTSAEQPTSGAKPNGEVERSEVSV